MNSLIQSLRKLLTFIPNRKEDAYNINPMESLDEERLLLLGVTQAEIDFYKANVKTFFKVRNAQARLTKIECECGKMITYVNRKKHFASIVHLKAIAAKAMSC